MTKYGIKKFNEILFLQSRVRSLGFSVTYMYVKKVVVINHGCIYWNRFSVR
jgi:hypothetical protein